MNRRDLFLTIGGVFLAIFGVGVLIYGNLTLALISLFLLIILLLILLLLQRRQLAAIQERTLRLLRSQKESSSRLKNMESQLKFSNRKDKSDASTKKILGILSAQQTSMELLNQKIEHPTLNDER